MLSSRARPYQRKISTKLTGSPFQISAYLILFAIVLGVNLLPTFGPPTRTIIVAYGLSSHILLAAAIMAKLQ